MGILLKISILLSLVFINVFAFDYEKLDKEQIKNARFIYNNTTNKDFAVFLIALSYKESSLRNNTTNYCDYRKNGRCYDSVGLFQINEYTYKKLNPKKQYIKIKMYLENKYNNLAFAKELIKSNHKYIINKKLKRSLSKEYILRTLQIYNGGAKNKDLAYANDIYKSYLQLKEKL